MTEEQKQARIETLARARETARLNRERREAAADAKLAAIEAVPEPEIEDEDDIPEVFPPQELVIGEVAAADETPDLSSPRELTDFDRFLAALDDDTRDLLDDSELREIYEAQQAKAREEKRATAKKAAVARALMAARISEGIVPAATAEEVLLKERMAEKVTFTVDLPDMGDIGLRIDQQVFLHGHTYTVTRAQYESMRTTQYLAQQAELLFEGKDRRHWLRRRARGSVDGHVDMGMAA